MQIRALPLTLGDLRQAVSSLNLFPSLQGPDLMGCHEH